MIKTIFLDMDDVCNNFMTYALKWLGLDVPSEWVGWSIHDNIISCNGANCDYADSRKLWEALNYDFWRSIPESKEFRWLLAWCKREVGAENIAILTGLPPYNITDCVNGKLDWIEKHFDFEIKYSLTNSKWLSARPDALLIDDSEINVQRFRGANGQAILYP